MPPTPIPTSSLPPLPTLLSSLRSGIFQTAHNPTNARTGSKYLRRRLRGPSAVEYYPRHVSVKALNADVAWSRYTKWNGVGSASAASGSGSGSGSAPAVEGEAKGEELKGQEGATAGSAENAESVEEGKQSEQKGEASASASTSTSASSKTKQASKPVNTAVPIGFVEVPRIPGAGWVDDARERMRVEEVAIRRMMGRGPPKKGEGKRSQLKKK